MGTARQLLAGLVGTVEDRLELFASEFQEEKFRLIQTFIWVGAAFFAGLLAVIFGSLTIIYVCHGVGRLIALAVLTAAYGSAGALIGIAARRNMTRASMPFEDSLRELARDRECIPPES